VKLLFTSRERLRLLEEQAYDVTGLSYPVPFSIAIALALIAVTVL
jgi:hypothetical protein